MNERQKEFILSKNAHAVKRLVDTIMTALLALNASLLVAGLETRQAANCV